MPKVNHQQLPIASGATAAPTAVASSPVHAKTARVRVIGLKADYIDRPLGLENPRPRLSWRLKSDERNVRQSAYRILVAGSEAALKAGRGDLWDSGKVHSGRSFGIEYAGRELDSRRRSWWQVQIWDEAGDASELSNASWWEMGLLHPQDWTAQWLAVEDDVTRADREAGLHWIWGENAREPVSRKFRLTFKIPAASREGVLVVGSSHKLNDVWIDGAPASIEGRAGYPAVSKITLGPMSRGEHLFAVEAVSVESEIDSYFPTRGGGMAAFARLALSNGEVVRITSGPQWKTSVTEDAQWYAPRYQDASWESARPSLMRQEQSWPETPAMHLRKVFTVEKKLMTARLYATALGAYEAHLNGQRIGSALLAPECTQFRKRVLYQTYDVTAMLEPGENVFGLTVGDGWYAGRMSGLGRYPWGPPPRRVLAQIELDFEDGSRQVVATEPGWHSAISPILSSDIYDGEVYDARIAQPEWNRVGFDDARWSLAKGAETPACKLTSQVSPPIRATQTLKPKSIGNPVPGVYVFDFGQNFAGWCRLRVQGRAGTRIELRHAETLTSSGEADQFNLRSAKAADVFILRGDAAEEVFEPHFTYHGFRYVQVMGLPIAPTDSTLEGIVVHSDLPISGSLRIDNPLIDRVWRNVVWTQRSNFVGIPTDCPQRDERLGWMGDAGSFWDSAAFNMDVSTFTHRHMNDVRDDQYSDGALPILAPQGKSIERAGTSPGWADAGIILPWILWQRYGDVDVIAENWEAMDRHINFVLGHNPDYVWRDNRGLDFGDWLAVDAKSTGDPTTPKDLIGTAFLAHSAKLLAEMAEGTGRAQDAIRLRDIYERVRTAFIANFLKPDGRVGNESQTSYVLAIGFGLVPDDIKKAAEDRLANNIRGRGVLLSTGILGTPYALDVLTDAGHKDLAYTLLLRTAYPSWEYMFSKGGTTIWERWNGDVSDDPMNSYNHYALGSIVGFLFRRIAGIDAAAPGFERIRVRPVLDPRVKKGGGDYDSVMGRISTDWTQSSDGGFTLEVTIPANATAYIHLRARLDGRIAEGGQEIARRNDMRIVDRSDHEAVIEVGSGTYRFVVNG